MVSLRKINKKLIESLRKNILKKWHHKFQLCFLRGFFCSWGMWNRANKRWLLLVLPERRQRQQCGAVVRWQQQQQQQHRQRVGRQGDSVPRISTPDKQRSGGSDQSAALVLLPPLIRQHRHGKSSASCCHFSVNRPQTVSQCHGVGWSKTRTGKLATLN